MIVRILPAVPFDKKILIFIAICASVSFLVQAAFMTGLQASSCSGVKHPLRILVAALHGAFITAGMVAVPMYIEPMRLIVSQLFGPHQPMLTGAARLATDAAAAAAATMKPVSQASIVPVPPGVPAVEGAAQATPLPTAPQGDLTIEEAQEQYTYKRGTMVGGAALPPVEYEEQTFKEMMIGSAYWAAFAGAYGIGAGSMIASKCT